jgi:adenylate cyclase
MVLCLLYPSKQQYERAIVEGQRAVELNPNYADASAALALSLSVAGQPEEALAILAQAGQLSPRFPATYFSAFSLAYGLTEQFDEAFETLQKPVA